MEDFNAKLEEEKLDECTGGYRTEVKNEKGDICLNSAIKKNNVNMYLSEKDRYVAKTYTNTNIGLDDGPVVTKIKSRMKQRKSRLENTRTRRYKHKKCSTEEINKVLMNIQEGILQNTEIENQWLLMRTKYTQK